MKQLLLVLAFLLFSNYFIAQNLTLAQILEVKKKDLGNVEEFLSAKGWEFKEAVEPTDEKFGSATFTYNKSAISNKAESFLIFFYGGYSDKTRISIELSNKIKYNEYISSIKNYGCKLINSKVEEGNIVKIYRGATTTFEVKSKKSSNSYNKETSLWCIFIFSNEDYDLNWREE